MDELVAFVRQQLDEDERVASGARQGRWATRTDSIGTREVYSATRDEARGGDSNVFPDAWHEGSAEHAARWDPVRVLAEVEAKRRILDEHAALTEDWQANNDPVNSQSTFDTVRGLEIAIELLAQPYAGQDGWREEWRLDAG